MHSSSTCIYLHRKRVFTLIYMYMYMGESGLSFKILLCLILLFNIHIATRTVVNSDSVYIEWCNVVEEMILCLCVDVRTGMVLCSRS